jgi:hypothetical protein
MKLVKLASGTYRLSDEGSSVEGAWPVIQARMQYEFEIEPDEIDRAIKDMRAKGTDVAEFGLNGLFIYSYHASRKKYVLAELRAILTLRQEFNAQFKVEPQGPETKQAFDRLMNVYMSLNVEAVVELLEKAEELIAA